MRSLVRNELNSIPSSNISLTNSGLSSSNANCNSDKYSSFDMFSFPVKISDFAYSILFQIIASLNLAKSPCYQKYIKIL